MGKWIAYFLVRLAVPVFGHLPFGVLYRISDLISWVLHKVVGYRRKIVRQNLERSFPDWDAGRIDAIERDFYRHLADLLVEGVKGLLIGKEELLRRYRFTNPELLNVWAEKGRHVFAMPAHYGNWEWGVLSFPVQIDHEVVGIYKKLHNPLIARYIDSRRTRFGLQLVPIQLTRKAFEHPPADPTLYIMMSDQTPSNAFKAQWVEFLNQDTACLWGADRWARRLDYPVFFMDIQRVKRGFYEITFSELELEPTQTEEASITRAYMHKLEEVIRKNPADWLWSHRRWKKKRPE
jgi:KDO2-lipid IV(A) lauroyltransferase